MYEIEDLLLKESERKKRRYSSFAEFRKQRNEEARAIDRAKYYEEWKERKEKQMERKYLKGFYVKKKESRFGSFYKCSIKYDDFINNLVPNDKGYVNFCIFEGKEGNPYAVIDDYTIKPNDEVKNFDDEQLPF